MAGPGWKFLSRMLVCSGRASTVALARKVSRSAATTSLGAIHDACMVLRSYRCIETGSSSSKPGSIGVGDLDVVDDPPVRLVEPERVDARCVDGVGGVVGALVLAGLLAARPPGEVDVGRLHPRRAVGAGREGGGVKGVVDRGRTTSWPSRLVYQTRPTGSSVASSSLIADDAAGRSGSSRTGVGPGR